MDLLRLMSFTSRRCTRRRQMMTGKTTATFVMESCSSGVISARKFLYLYTILSFSERLPARYAAIEALLLFCPI